MRTLLSWALFGALLAGCGSSSSRPVAVVGDERISVQQLAAVLPPDLDTGAAGATARLRALNTLIDKRLFVREALRRGKDKDIELQLDADRKFLVMQRLYDAVTEPAGNVSDAELRTAHELLKTEAHMMVIMVPFESTARRIAAELDQGVPFETLAARWSKHPSGAKGGDVGFVPMLYVDKPVRAEVTKLAPGGQTPPTKTDEMWQIVRVVEKRPASPEPPGLDDKEFYDQLKTRVQQQQRREVATRYVAGIKARLTYEEPGMQILMNRPVDSLTEQELDAAVAVKDGKQYVKVRRLTKVAAKFPAYLDTAMKRYAITREVEEDLMYEDGLRRRLDKLPKVASDLATRHDDLLYAAVYDEEVRSKVVITDGDIAAYYAQSRDRFVEQDLEKAKPYIKNQLTQQRHASALAEYAARLRAEVEITVDTNLLATVRPIPPPKEKKGR